MNHGQEDLAKKEIFVAVDGKCSKSKRWKILETTGEKGNILFEEALTKCPIFSETKVLPIAVICSMMIYTIFAMVYYHIDC